MERIACSGRRRIERSHTRRRLRLERAATARRTLRHDERQSSDGGAGNLTGCVSYLPIWLATRNSAVAEKLSSQ